MDASESRIASEGTTTSSATGEEHSVSRAVTETTSRVAEATASHDAKRRPMHFREADVSAAVWSREVPVNGEPVTFYSVSLERAYRDRDGARQYSKSFDPDDLGALVTVIQRAAEYIQGLTSAREPKPARAV